jgi:hypothetical protein
VYDRRRGLGYCALALALVTSCGYSLGARKPQLISVAPVAEQGIDVDAAAYVNTALREAVARSLSARLVEEEASEASLLVTLVGTDAPLLPFADPGARAAQYRAVVSLKGQLISRTGKVLWTSEVINGESNYLNPGGAIEVLDGMRRTALARAAEDAAARLVASLTLSRVF